VSTDKPAILRNKKNIKGSSKNLGLGSVVKIQEGVLFKIIVPASLMKMCIPDRCC
jgi:hypothetical protein